MLLRIAIVSVLFLSMAFATKIKDISSVVGIRDNQLLGYGLIVGLNGTGDGSSSQFTLQSLANMLESVNVKVDVTAIKSKNVAAVMVTAKLPPFGRQGDKIDVVISSIGDAKSLEGGTLLMTPLKGVDGQIYAIAQGPISIGGRKDGGGAVNHPLAGSVFGGAVIEREVSFDLYSKEKATLSLKESNFANAVSTQDAINSSFGKKVALAVDPRTIKLEKPQDMSMVEFLAKVENLNMDFTNKDKIVIDERTGTIVSGVNVTIDPVVVTRGQITVKIASDKALTQEVTIDNANNLVTTNDDPPTVANVTRALQKLGATPKDIISILEAIKKAGAIRVDVEII